MQNGIPLGQGNSRKFKGAAANIPATYEEFRTLMINSGIPFDLILNEGGWAQLGDPLNANTLLKSTTAALLGLPNTAVPDDALRALTRWDWQLIQSYTAAGNGNWVAPDIYGDGSQYTIGVFVIGGGGSGGAFRSSAGGTATGGASGYTASFTLIVTPGYSYPYVVGAKGASVTATSAASGNSGGTSSFNGVSALGGGGGSGANPAPGADGGQGSDGAYNSNSTTQILVAPSRGRGTVPSLNGSVIIPGGLSAPLMCLNPFDRKVYLGAGGRAYALYNNSGATQIKLSQASAILDDGLASGSGGASTNASIDLSNSGATSPGSGGGAAACGYGATSTAVCVSGAGAPGAVFIYKKGAAQS